MSDDTGDDDWPELRQETHEHRYDDARDDADGLKSEAVDEGWGDDTGNELGTQGNEGWEDDIGSDDIEKTSIVSATLACDDCGDEMDVSSGSSNYECSCGHSVRTIVVPARMMEEIE